MIVKLKAPKSVVLPNGRNVMATFDRRRKDFLPHKASLKNKICTKKPRIEGCKTKVKG